MRDLALRVYTTVLRRYRPNYGLGSAWLIYRQVVSEWQLPRYLSKGTHPADARSPGFGSMASSRFGLSLVGAMFCASPVMCHANPRTSVPVERFLGSIGVVTTFPDRGQPLSETIKMIRYGGFGWVRGGIEGLTASGPTTLQTYLDMHRATGVKISWGLVSGGTDIAKLVSTGRVLAKAGALLAFEGNNEPNNWGVVVNGVKGGGKDGSWRPVAAIQKSLYSAIKADPLLVRFPVWSISEAGAQIDNVGLQFLTIPVGAGTLMPSGTHYATHANLHNYPVDAAKTPLPDNVAWNAADPTAAARADGLYGNHGKTWHKQFRGYPQTLLNTLPRVTTETGVTLQGAINEERQGALLLNIYLSQFKRGISHTSVYILRDRTDESGNQTFGFFKSDYHPRRSAVYLHNFTKILGQAGDRREAAEVEYDIPQQPGTIHDLLLRGKDGINFLIIWGERGQGGDRIQIRFQTNLHVRVYDPTIGGGSIANLPNTNGIKMMLTDHPIVLAITSKNQILVGAR